MTQEEPTSEVFLGPTGSETEEFYCYQRSNPGLEKSDYLDWFQKRFNKEIELRRRRSDQPSDLEFMVIKKRSKYRERIGEESAELVRHSEQHPQKTYRELAEWFQDRFGKEIDITAISSELPVPRSPPLCMHVPSRRRPNLLKADRPRVQRFPQPGVTSKRLTDCRNLSRSNQAQSTRGRGHRGAPATPGPGPAQR